MLSGSSYIPPFYFYKFAQAISDPYTSLNAYRGGVIDENGNLIKPESSIEPFEYLVIKLKKIFELLPYNMTKAKLGSYLSTLQLFSEEAADWDLDAEQVNLLIEGYVTAQTDGKLSYIELLEDMGTGGGAGAIGVPGQVTSQGGVMGFDPPLGVPMMRRKNPKYMDSCEVFDVCPEEFESFKSAKAWKHVADSETKNYLKRFQQRNKNAKMAVRTKIPQTGEHQLFWIKYPGKDFIEEYNIPHLDILKENFNIADDTQIGFLTETKKKVNPRTHDDDHQQFMQHITELMNLHKNEKKLSRKSEYEARLINHIKNYNTIKSNKEQLKKYIDFSHPTILNSASSSSTDSHFIHVADDGSINFKPVDVKDISRGDAYVGKEIGKEKLLKILGKADYILDDESSSEVRIDKTIPDISTTIKKQIDQHYADNANEETNNFTPDNLFMIKSGNGRFYMAGPNAVGETTERKIRLSPTGQQRRSRAKGLAIPHPNYRRLSARVVHRVLDPTRLDKNIKPVSINSEEYESTKNLLGTEFHDYFEELTKPHRD